MLSFVGVPSARPRVRECRRHLSQAQGIAGRHSGSAVEGGAGFFEQGAGFGFLLLEAFDDVRRGFGEEAFVAELALGGGDAFFVFGDVFGQAFALGGDVDWFAHRSTGDFKRWRQ